MRKRLIICLGALMLGASANAGELGDIVEVGPIKGEFFEGFENVPGGVYPSLNVFDSLGKVTAFGGDEQPGGHVVDVLPGIFFGVHLGARSGDHMMGTTFDDFGFTPAVRWTFDTPATQFGGYFGTVNTNTDATANFYDENNTLIGTDQLDVPLGDWAWSGWEMETGGISRVEIFGNGFFGPGLIFYDDMEFTPIPAPSALIALLGLPMVHARRRRH